MTRPRPCIPPLLLPLLLLALSLLVAGCGGDGGRGDGDEDARSGDRGGAATDEDGPSIDAQVVARIESVGDKTGGAGVPVPKRATCTKSVPATCQASLSCPPLEGMEERDTELCRWLAGPGRLALEQPGDNANQACTEIYGGPEVATVTGTLDGTTITPLTFSRENGCEIARWDAAAPLWTGEVDGPSDDAPAPTTHDDPPSAFE